MRLRVPQQDRYRRGALLLAGLLLVGCASPGIPTPDMPDRFKPPKRVAVDTDRQKLARSAQSPLYDLNVMRERIPDELREIGYVYAFEPTADCRAIEAEVARLDGVLGPDPAEVTKEGDGTLTLETADALEQAIDSFVPFTGVIRYLSGATEHEKRLAAAYLRGEIRRAFLNGARREKGCHVPAPRRKPVS